MVTDLSNLARHYGVAVEEATLARDLLAPVKARLSGDPSGVHLRCVLVKYHGFFQNPDDARADLAKFGDIEAVCICRTLHIAVVVFWNDENATTALRRQPMERIDLYIPVLPLYISFPVPLIHPDLIEVTTYPPRPVFVVLNTVPSARPRGSARGPPGTTEFMPFFEEGPRRGDDGQLYVDGAKFTYYEKGMQIDFVSMPVVQVAPPATD